MNTTRVVLEFETRYELELLDRIDRRRVERVFQYSERVANADGQSVDPLSQPSYELTGFAAGSAQRPEQMSIVATGVDPQQEMHDGPILAVHPSESPPWIGVFSGGGYGVPPAAPATIVAMPDSESFCVVRTGLACIIHVDHPEQPERVETFPVTDIHVVTEHKVVLLADFTDLVAYGQAGKLWSSGRLAWDDLKIVGVNGTGIEMTGFHAPRNDPRYPFTVDLSTGESDTKPYDW